MRKRKILRALRRARSRGCSCRSRHPHEHCGACLASEILGKSRPRPRGSLVDALQHDTQVPGAPCSRCGLRYSRETAYVACFLPGDTLEDWLSRQSDVVLDATPLSGDALAAQKAKNAKTRTR